MIKDRTWKNQRRVLFTGIVFGFFTEYLLGNTKIYENIVRKATMRRLSNFFLTQTPRRKKRTSKNKSTSDSSQSKRTNKLKRPMLLSENLYRVNILGIVHESTWNLIGVCFCLFLSKFYYLKRHLIDCLL